MSQVKTKRPAKKATRAAAGAKKMTYYFGKTRTDGRGVSKQILGGKGANLAEMTSIGLPVPPGFTITTEVCTYYYGNKKNYPKILGAQVKAAVAGVERIMGSKFGDKTKMPMLTGAIKGKAIFTYHCTVKADTSNPA